MSGKVWDDKWYMNRVKGREGVFSFVADTCLEAKCETVLDVGGGVGLLHWFLASHIKHDVLDFSMTSKTYGERLFPDVRFIVGTMDKINQKYDAIVGMQFVEHISHYSQFFSHAWDNAEKIVIATFRNGLNGNEIIQFQKTNKYGNYWDNVYSLKKLSDFINDELSPSNVWIERVSISRPYSPEIVLVLEK